MKLSILGGDKVRQAEFTKWPNYDHKEIYHYFNEICKESLFRGTRFPLKWYNEMNDNLLEKMESEFAKMHNCQYGFFVNSGTSALDLALKALNLQTGDEVLVTPYTFYASASVIKKNNGIPVFVDIESQTLNMDVEKARKCITNKTKAIVIVHFGGIPANMRLILQLAKDFHLNIIEDCCHTLYAKYNEKSVGSFGLISCYSFQNTKLLSCGEGGAVLTNDLCLAEKLFSLHNSGRMVDKFGKEEFVYLGNNFRFPLACLPFFEIGFRKSYKEFYKRAENVAYFKLRLSLIDGLKMIEDNKNNIVRDYYIVAIRYDKKKFFNLSLKRFIIALNAEGIPCTMGYAKALYEIPTLIDSEYKANEYKSDCVETEKAKQEIFWLSHNLFLGSKQDIDDIVKAICKVRKYGYELVRKK